MTQTGSIFDIKKFSIHDGPGIRTTVFFQGCPLSCVWCHNPEGRSIDPVLMYRINRCILCGECAKICPRNAITLNSYAKTDRVKCDVCGTCADTCYNGAREISGSVVTVDEVMAVIKRDTPFYKQSGGGVTFSGGEPLNQSEFLFELLAACHDCHIHTTVDTSGFADWETLKSICQNVDLFLYDLKLMDEEKHIQFTGVSNQQILENLKRLADEVHPVVVRIPFIPGINDDDANFHEVGGFLSSQPSLTSVEIMGYHDIGAAKYEALGISYPLSGTKPPSLESLQRSAGILKEHGLSVKIS